MIVAESVAFLASDREIVEPDGAFGFVIESRPACQFEPKHLYRTVLGRDLELGGKVLPVVGTVEALAVRKRLGGSYTVDGPVHPLG